MNCPPIYTGNPAADQAFQNLQVVNTFVARRLIGCDVAARSLTVNGQEILPPNSLYLTSKFPNWCAVNLETTVPMTASYPGDEPHDVYTVPGGRLALVTSSWPNDVLMTARDTGGKRYFLSESSGSKLYDIHPVLDEGDVLEYWNTSGSDEEVIVSLVEFDKGVVNGCSWLLLRGTQADFPLSYTVPAGHSARLAPSMAGGGDQAFSINELIIIGTDSASTVDFKVTMNNNPSLFSSEDLAASPHPATGEMVAPINIFAAGTTLTLDTDDHDLGNQSFYCTLQLQETSC